MSWSPKTAARTRASIDVDARAFSSTTETRPSSTVTAPFMSSSGIVSESRRGNRQRQGLLHGPSTIGRRKRFPLLFGFVGAGPPEQCVRKLLSELDAGL